jgi:hypothetical protein
MSWRAARPLRHWQERPKTWPIVNYALRARIESALLQIFVHRGGPLAMLANMPGSQEPPCCARSRWAVGPRWSGRRGRPAGRMWAQVSSDTPWWAINFGGVRQKHGLSLNPPRELGWSFPCAVPEIVILRLGEGCDFRAAHLCAACPWVLIGGMLCRRSAGWSLGAR